MATTKNSRLDYSTRVAKQAMAAFETLRGLEATASDYADLYGAELANDDYTGTTLEGLDKADIDAAIQGIVAIGNVLSDNNGALRKTFKRLAQFGNR